MGIPGQMFPAEAGWTSAVASLLLVTIPLACSVSGPAPSAPQATVPAGMEVAVVLSRAGEGGKPLWSGTAPIYHHGEVRLAVPKVRLPPGSYSLSWAEAGSDESVAGIGDSEPPRQEQYRFTVVATPPR